MKPLSAVEYLMLVFQRSITFAPLNSFNSNIETQTKSYLFLQF